MSLSRHLRQLLLCASVAGLIGVNRSAVAGDFIIYVDDNGSNAGPGFTWDIAFRFLHDALAFASDPQHGVTEIRIAQGTYKPDHDSLHINGTSNINATFQLVSGIPIRGGYAGAGAPDPDARDVVAYPTILSGDLHGDDTGDPHDPQTGDNSIHVITADNLASTTLLDGVTISSGHSTGYDGIAYGSAIQIETGQGGALQTIDCAFVNNSGGSAIAIKNCNASLSHCTVSNNRDGVLLRDSSHVSIANCTFDGNSSTAVINAGTGVMTIANCTFTNNDIAAHGPADITNCTFEDNDGGVLSAQGSINHCVFSHNVGAIGVRNTLVVNDCSFDGHNNGNSSAAAIYLNRHADLTLNHCTFTNNHSGSGGAISNDDIAQCTMKDCVFQNNSAFQGGAIYSYRRFKLKATNCIFRDNFAQSSGGAISTYDTQNHSQYTHIYTNCVFFNNSAGERGGAIDSPYTNLQLRNCTVVRNDALFGSGIKLGAHASALILNSIFKGNTTPAFSGHGKFTINYCNISGGYPGEGNINKQALFVDIENGDLRLLPGSGCIDAGRSNYLSASITTDLAGNPRFVNDPDTPNTGIGSLPVDIGAYEFQGN